jgi:hypothetical protein
MIGKRGKFTGNGAAQNISLGFKPDFVIIINVTDGTTIEFFIDDTPAPPARSTSTRRPVL